MNLLITTVCNRKCRFCFAQMRLDGTRKSSPYMSLDRIDTVMNMLEKDGQRQLRLLGGEPTLHPEFPAIIDRAVERNFNLLIFSNGMMPEQAVQALEKLPEEQVGILCNISPQADDHPRLLQRRDEVMARLGPRMVPGVTLSDVNEPIDVEPLLTAIRMFKMKKQIRVGVAQPIVGRNNEHIRPEEYPQVGARIAAMAKRCIQEDVLLGFDCGITPCMFSGSEWETVMTCTSGYKSVCQPIIDVGPDGDLWHCFPLSEVFNLNLSDFSSRSEIVEAYRKKMSPLQRFGCGSACVRCAFRLRGQCFGGCLAHAAGDTHLPDSFGAFKQNES